jgi:hypothetical protein
MGDSQKIPIFEGYPYVVNIETIRRINNMKKSSLFISAVLTTFVLAVVAGAITASRYFGTTSNANTVQQVAPVSQTVSTIVTAEQAAQIAANTLGRTDLYSVETGMINGQVAYKVTFSSGDVAYVDTNGQVLSVVAAAPLVQQSQPSVSIFGGEGEHNGDGD